MTILLLSKIFYFFLAPAHWIFILLIWRYFATGILLKRRLAVTCIATFLLFSNEYIFTKVALAWQPPLANENIIYEAGIVVGGFSSFDKKGNGYFSNAADRFVQVTKLYRQGTIKNIVVSGGSLWGDKPAEASFVKQQLQLQGIPASNIFCEEKSRNTFENATYTRVLLDSLKLFPPFLLITSALHMPRAKGIFKKAGVNVTGHPSNYLVVDRQMDWDDFVIPRIEVLDKWSLLIKEIAGVIVYKMAGKI